MRKALLFSLFLVLALSLLPVGIALPGWEETLTISGFVEVAAEPEPDSEPEEPVAESDEQQALVKIKPNDLANEDQGVVWIVEIETE